MTGVSDGEMVAVKVAVAMIVIVAVGRFEAVDFNSGSGTAFCEKLQETRKISMAIKKINCFIYTKKYCEVVQENRKG